MVLCIVYIFTGVFSCVVFRFRFSVQQFNAEFQQKSMGISAPQ